MKKLSVWLGALLLTATMAVPVFAAQRPDCCVEKEKAGITQMRSQQETFPWETPGGVVKGRTANTLAE